MTQLLDDDPSFHPYRLDPNATASSPSSSEEASTIEAEWIDPAELQHATDLASQRPQPLKFLVLYGSLRER
jgi:hypothetical protein